MTTAPPRQVVFHARRARRWAVVAACLATALVVIALIGHSPRWSLAIYAVACILAWRSVLAQHRSVQTALSIQRANER